MARVGSFRLVALAACSLGCLALSGKANAQIVGGGFIRQIGGVSISAEGVVKMPAAADVKLQRAAYEKALADFPTDAKGGLGLRMVSLRSIEKALASLKP